MDFVAHVEGMCDVTETMNQWGERVCVLTHAGQVEGVGLRPAHHARHPVVVPHCHVDSPELPQDPATAPQLRPTNTIRLYIHESDTIYWRIRF